ncbi:MAG: hypothetical protein SH868_14480 [Bythopirellula sp.]|nr:hypothetical protein [Bythopirellula sp.]
MVSQSLNPEFRKTIDEWVAVMDSAVLNARAESRRLGVPNVYWIDGQHVFELPNGEVTETVPEGWVK